MKIAIYKDTFANNRGADVAVRNLAEGLAERGHSVTLFTKSEFEAKVHGDIPACAIAGGNPAKVFSHHDLDRFARLKAEYEAGRL